MKTLFLLLFPISTIAQPPKAKTIIVKNISFNEVCNALLDKGYSIEKKDDQLQTARTEYKAYPKLWNAGYRIDIRIKDSAAYITCAFTAPYERLLTPNSKKTDPLWNNESAYYHVNKKGQAKSLPGVAFSYIKEFALSLGKEVEYKL